MLRLALAQLNATVGDIAGNEARIGAAIAEAQERGGFFHAALQQHSQQRDRDRIIMHDHADEQKVVRRHIVQGLMFGRLPQGHRLDERVDA